MKLIKLIGIYLVAFISCSFFIAIDIPSILIFFILFCYLALFMIFPYINTIFWTKNIKKIDLFLKNNRKKVFFKYSYSVVHGSEDEQKTHLQEIIKLSQHPNDQQHFKVMLALLNNNYLQAILEADQIPDEEIRHYTMAFAEVSNGNIQQAFILTPYLKTPWRQHAIRALIAGHNKKHDEFLTYSTHALSSTRGLDHYLLHHLLEKIKFHLPKF